VQDKLARLSAAGIAVIPADLEKHHILERDGFIALVERTADGGFGRSGTAGLLTEKGLAPLVWRGAAAFFVAKGLEAAASEHQIEALRSFQRDLDDILTDA
jgi:hypothetical protein